MPPSFPTHHSIGFLRELLTRDLMQVTRLSQASLCDMSSEAITCVELMKICFQLLNVCSSDEKQEAMNCKLTEILKL